MTYVEKLKELPDRFTFLVIGAADGNTLDEDLFQTIKEKKAKGVFVEPLADLYNLLIRNYQGMEGIEFVNAAIDDRAGKRIIHRVPISECSPKWRLGLGSFYLDRNLISSAPHVTERVDTIRLVEVLPKEPVDLLQIDTEGHDWIVFNQWMFWRGHPQLICVENTRVPEIEKPLIALKLANAGYQTFQDGDNLVGWL